MKNFKILALITAIALIFCSCGASTEALDSKNEYFDGGWIEPETPMEAPEMESVADDLIFDSTSSTTGPSENQYSGNRKLIRNFNLEVETLDFDSFVSDLKTEINSLGGYLESSSVSGNSYNYSGNRYADFVCRVPSAKLDEFVNTVGGLGNVTYSYEDTTDITLNYVDTEARIKSLQTEYDQLLELLAEAENIDTIILLQQRLTEVRYQLESYQSQLRTYDNLVDYSTVRLNVREVERITPQEQKTVWERISADFGDNIYDIFVGAENFFVWFVASIPYFIIWAVIIAGIVFVAGFIFRKNPKWQERKAARKARKEYKKAQKLANKAETENTEEK